MSKGIVQKPRVPYLWCFIWSGYSNYSRLLKKVGLCLTVTCRHTHLQRKKLPLAKVVKIETCLFNTDYKHQYLTVTNSMTSQLSQRCRDTMASPQPDCLVSPSWMRTTAVIVITHQWEHVTVVTSTV